MSDKNNSKQPVAAVVVEGGGIAGMQASLDLAQSGFRVHLIEKRTAIGGKMAGLDKTFPTNDCAMCIMSPKLVEVGRHPNIELITGAEIASIDGEAGDFSVAVVRQPRYIDIDKCTGCGDCASVCPISLPSEFDRGLAVRKATYKLYAQATPNAYAIEKLGVAPCRDACPAGVSAHGYVALIRAGKFSEALALEKRDNPFPHISGLACPRPCEKACSRREVDNPVPIRALKLFLARAAESGEFEPKPVQIAADKSQRVAIVGAGPAGLTAAYYLRLKGYAVALYEAADESGGSFNRLSEKVLPAEVRRAEIESILKTGIELHPGKTIDQNNLLDLIEKHDAVLLAVGADNAKDDDPKLAGARQALRETYREADAAIHLTSLPKVFAAGELTLGKKPFINAIGSGKEAAESIDRYLRRVDLRAGRNKRAAAPTPTDKIAEARERQIGQTAGRIKEIADAQQAIEAAEACLDCGVCCECYQCVEACGAGAIDHEQRVQNIEIDAGSVILAPGFEPIPTSARQEFGHGRYRNVVTSLEFERILSASGPFEGHIQRPSDGAEPHKIAWIQCVGSRDSNTERPYCSSVCCMYAVKEAVIAREHNPNIEPSIFYIDLRAFGKGFDDYVERARDKGGVRFVRSMVSRVFEDPQTGNLQLRYYDESGERCSETFDMVVLSVGLCIPSEIQRHAVDLGITLDPYGFAETDTYTPLNTSRPGIFACGAFTGPKDIPETVGEASAAAAAASAGLAAERGSRVSVQAAPLERDLTGEEPRIGVFVCHCGINIASVVDVDDVTRFASELPGVVVAEHLLYSCSQDNLLRIREAIEQHSLNRVVVSSCSPRTHEPLFQETVRASGLNKYMFDMANIRDQCSWVHQFDKELATEKAKRLTAMSVANVSLALPLHEHEIPVTARLLVIGGGLAGMTAAIEAAKQGVEVVLVERDRALGGNLRNLRRTFDGKHVADLLTRLISQIEREDRITVHTGSMIVEHTGYLGNFVTEIITPGGVNRRIEHGALLLATGGNRAQPDLYGLNSNPAVITQTDFEQLLADRPQELDRVNRVVMIQCAGSRNEDRPYCSRVCCNQAIKNASEFKRLRKKSRVDVLYRDIRSYGLNELQYLEARGLGVNFVRYDPATNPIEVDSEKEITVEIDDLSIKRRLILKPDLLVLSTGIEATDTAELSGQLKLARNGDGFFIEAHAKLRPVDFPGDGMFLAGLAHGPKSISETITQAEAAVSRAMTVLSQSTLRLPGVVSVVDPTHCAVCLTCVRACPYGVPVINAEHAAEINPALCHGCGICVAECPAHAITIGAYENERIMAKLDVLGCAGSVNVT